MSSASDHKPNFFNGVRAAVGRYLGRRLTDPEFADMCDKIEIIERSEDVMLSDANFVIGDALFRRFDSVLRGMAILVIMAFLALVFLATALFGAGKAFAAREATFEARQLGDARIAKICSVIDSDLSMSASRVSYGERHSSLSNSPEYQALLREHRELLRSCSNALDFAVAHTPWEPTPAPWEVGTTSERPHIKHWTTAGICGVVAVILVGLCGFAIGRRWGFARAVR